METLELRSFDGRTLLGFLAGLGALRLARANGPVHDVQLAFDESDGHARLRCPCHTATQLTDLIVKGLLSVDNHRLWALDDGKGGTFGHPSEMSQEDVRHLARVRLERPALDAVGALVADAPDANKGVVSTGLRAVGGGQLQFFGQIADIFEALTEEQCRRTLAEPWRHADKSGGMRWAPEEDRSYALLASDPSADGASGERAANALAIFALSYFPTFPSGETAGFDPKARTRTFAWPLWGELCGEQGIKALVACAGSMSREELERRGVFRVMAAARVTRGQYRNFCPPRAEW